MLDIVTFTGFRAGSFTEVLLADGTLVLVANNERLLTAAKRCYGASVHTSKINLVSSRSDYIKQIDSFTLHVKHRTL